MNDKIYDLCVIGGGINGAGIARDAAGRGNSVILVEMNDLASATSSASTKLIHGGLRYLEYYEFKLVREALKEREVLLNLAPHIIWPLEFILPHDSHLRPAWMIRMGLFLYDHLGGRLRKLKHSRGVNLSSELVGFPLKDTYRKGFSYADCWVNDARMVALNAVDAAARGADILTRTKCTNLKVVDGIWHIELDGKKSIRARKLVNATGPWVFDTLKDSGLTTPETPHIRLVKGSHIVVPRIFEGPQAYILQQPDRRIVFAIPYEDNFTLIGTTDEDYHGNPSDVKISGDETEYLCAAVNRSFRTQIEPKNVIWTYSGTRPLFDDGHSSASAVTRDYKLIYDESAGAPLLSVFGGKITTFRALSEHAVDRICGGTPWTAKAPLPGGDMKNADFDEFFDDINVRYTWLPHDLAYRYARMYGSRLAMIVGNAQSLDDLGTHFGDGVYEAEIKYLVEHEWAKTLDDVLWRRTKLGLHVNAKTYKALELYPFPKK